MSDSEDPVYRIICIKNRDYCLTIRGGLIVFALKNPFDRYQHWIKDERDGATEKDSEGQPTFALVNKATGQAIGHCPKSKPLPLVQHHVNSSDKSVLWTMSKYEHEEFRYIRKMGEISLCWVARNNKIYDGHIVDLYNLWDQHEKEVYLWKFVKVLPSTCISLFRPSQHTVKIICEAKKNCNLSIDKDGTTVLLVPSNPKDKYQHWIIETAYGVPVKDIEGKVAFALVNKATGKAIKHGFGSNSLVQVAPLNRNYMDPSLLWTKGDAPNGFQQIRWQSNIDLKFTIFDAKVVDFPLLGLSKDDQKIDQQWKIEDFE